MHVGLDRLVGASVKAVDFKVPLGRQSGLATLHRRSSRVGCLSALLSVMSAFGGSFSTFCGFPQLVATGTR